MNTKRDSSIFIGLVAFLTLVIAYKVLKRAINMGISVFLLLVVILMIYLLGR